MDKSILWINQCLGNVLFEMAFSWTKVFCERAGWVDKSILLAAPSMLTEISVTSWQ